MPRTQPPQQNFNAGEFSERLEYRTDFSKFKNALSRGENVVCLPEGGVFRRAGARYVAATKTGATVKSRIKRFEYSTEQAYVLEVGEQNMRFFKDQAQIVVQNTDSAIANGTFDSDLTSWTDRSTGSGAQAHDSGNNAIKLTPGGTATTDLAWTEQAVSNTVSGEHVLHFRVLGAPGDSVKLRIGTASTGSQLVLDFKAEVGWHAYSFTATGATFYVQFINDGSVRNKALHIDDVSLIDDAPLEVTTPWPEAVLYRVEGPQSADVLYLYNVAHPTHKLERRGHARWAIVQVDWQDGPWLNENETATTITPTAATGLGIDLTASSILGINNDTGFQSTDVGRLIRYTDATVDWGWGVIVSVTSTTVVKVDIRRTMNTTTAETKWILGSWSATTGYPSGGVFFDQRLFSFHTTLEPQNFWGSNVADFQNMAPDSDPTAGTFDGTVEGDDSIDWRVGSNTVEAINWMSAGEESLQIGTRGGEWQPSSVGAALAPDDIAVHKATSHGSAEIQPLRVGRAVLFVQKAKRKIWELAYSFEANGLEAFDMTRLAFHITRGGVVEMDYAEEPNSLVWAPREDGVVPTMTFRRDEDVVGWTRQIIGGEFKNDIANAKRVWQYDASADTYVEETNDAKSTTDADVTLFPASEAVGDYVAFGFDSTFAQLTFDYANGTAGVGGVVAWEYWNGTAWTAVSGLTDGTVGFTTAAADSLTVTWTMPTDWEKSTVKIGKAQYYVRARVTTVYSTNPIIDQLFVQETTAAVVESITVIPGTNGSGQVQDSTSRDEVWCQVKRTINGATVRYIEVFERDYENGHEQEDAYYSDALVTYDGNITDTITGITHLEGQVVKVLADGAVQADKTVASGSITLDEPASVVQIGLGYTHKLKTLPHEGGSPSGTAVGRVQRISGVTFALLNSHGITFGTNEGDLIEHDFRQVADEIDTAAPLFSGQFFHETEGDWEEDPRLYIESDSPTPFTLLDMIPEVDVKPMT